MSNHKEQTSPEASTYMSKYDTDIKPDSENPTVVAPKVAKPRPFRRTLKYLGFLMFFGFVVFAGFVTKKYSESPVLLQTLWKWVSNLGTAINKRDPLAEWTFPKHIPKDNQKSLTLLVLGIDYDYSDTQPGKVLTNTKGRSDAIMLARFDFEDKTISVLSIPRDCRVQIPGHGHHKINAAHSYGGPELSKATIASVFGVKPDYYVAVNFHGFQQIVDSIGGVDLMIHDRLKYDDNWGNLHIDLKPGFQHLNGYQAMGYVRIRRQDNDLKRAQRQQEFLAAMKSKIMSPNTFLALPSLVNAISDNLKSDLNNDQLLTLTNFARSVDKQNIRLETVPVREGRSYVEIKRSQADSIIRRMFYDNSAIAVNVEAPSATKKRRLIDGYRPRPKADKPEKETTEQPSGLIQHNPNTTVEGENKTETEPQPPAPIDPKPQPTNSEGTLPDQQPKPEKPAEPDKPSPSDTPIEKQPKQPSTPKGDDQ